MVFSCSVPFNCQQCVKIKEYLYVYVKLNKIVDTPVIIVTEIKIKRSITVS